MIVLNANVGSVFQQCRDVNKSYKLISSTTRTLEITHTFVFTLEEYYTIHIHTGPVLNQFDQLLPIGSRASIYYLLFKYTQQHATGFTEQHFDPSPRTAYTRLSISMTRSGKNCLSIFMRRFCWNGTQLERYVYNLNFVDSCLLICSK